MTGGDGLIDGTTAFEAATGAHRAGRVAEAAAGYRRALTLAPSLAVAWGNLGHALGSGGFDAEAATAYRRAMTTGGELPGIADALTERLSALGDGAWEAGRVGEALDLYREADGLRRTGREWILDRLMRGLLEADPLASLEYAERLWVRLPDDPIRTLNYWNLATKAGIGSGIDACRRGLNRRFSPAGLIALGNALTEAGREAEADAAYARAAALHPDQPFVYSRSGCLHLRHRNHARADRLLRRAALWPGRDEAMRFDPAFIADRVAAFRTPAPAEGDWRIVDRRMPRATGPGEPVLVFSACDGAYFDRFASAMIHSTRRNAGLETVFHLHVVNPPDDLETRVNRWDRVLGHPGIGWSRETLDVSTLGADAKTHYACARFLALPALLRRWNGPILMLDADLIVLRDLRAMMAAVRDADLALVGGERYGFEPWNQYWADVIVIHPTPRALAFFDRVAAYIDHFLRIGKARWFLDQIALNAVLSCGFPDAPAPAVHLLARDVHRLELREGDDDVPPSHCLFWSAHASTVSTNRTVETPFYGGHLLD